MQLNLPALDRGLSRYLLFGGLPAAVAEATEPSNDVRRIVWDPLVKYRNNPGLGLGVAAAKAHPGRPGP